MITFTWARCRFWVCSSRWSFRCSGWLKYIWCLNCLGTVTSATSVIWWHFRFTLHESPTILWWVQFHFMDGFIVPMSHGFTLVRNNGNFGTDREAPSTITLDFPFLLDLRCGAWFGDSIGLGVLDNLIARAIVLACEPFCLFMCVYWLIHTKTIKSKIPASKVTCVCCYSVLAGTSQ